MAHEEIVRGAASDGRATGDIVLAELTRRLSAVPPFTPQLVRLAWLLCDDEGECDMEKAAQHAVELSDALDEARSYTKAVEDLRWRLSKLT